MNEVEIHIGGSQHESWITIYRDGRVKEVGENDGAYALRHGIQRAETWGRIEDYARRYSRVREAWEAMAKN